MTGTRCATSATLLSLAGTVLLLAASLSPVLSLEASVRARDLQARLDADPAAVAQVSEQARNAGLNVVDVSAGGPGSEEKKWRVAGGGKPFADCPILRCPELVLVPATPPGFQIGSPPDEPNRQSDEDQRILEIAPFAAGQFEVTVGQYRTCVAAGGCRPPEWLEPDNQNNVETGVSNYYRSLGASLTDPSHPIVGVSWTDAMAYVGWVSRETGRSYRLLSEAEWEHAARAGAMTPFWWGRDVRENGKAWANCVGCGSMWDGKSLAPVKSFEPNPWGLYNVHGNVWEWVADRYCETRDGGPADGSARTGDDCPDARFGDLKVLRGGSAFYAAHLARAAVRLRNRPDFRNSSVGFRVARPVMP